MDDTTTRPPTSAEYLDEIIQKSLRNNRRIRYDSDIAETIGVARSTLSQYRKKSPKSMSVLVAVRIAYLLDINPMVTIAATMWHQARNDSEKHFWAITYNHYLRHK